ncbi:CopG family ribbon-helix-helix protein [Pseudomonas gingeri]|uniref:CopG family ribbon-helix-helix protein n=1 Tax=Pseudomonas gingeri TaxID=117681 RepID=UPI003F7545A4
MTRVVFFIPRRCIEIEVPMPVVSRRRPPDEMTETLSSLAKAIGCSKSFLTADTLRDDLACEAQQVAETQLAMEEADKGDFATDEEVEATFRKWGADAH